MHEPRRATSSCLGTSAGIPRRKGIALLLALLFLVNAFAQQKTVEDADPLNKQARQLYVEGRYPEAIPLAQRALAITEEATGSEHPDTARSLNNLAALYVATGAYAKAEPLYQRALRIHETIDPKGLKTATSLNNLATLYLATGAYAKAEPLLKRALEIVKTDPGPEHPHTATSLNNLAALYVATGTYAKAEPLFQRALAICEKALGPDHPDTATSLNNLAELYRITGAYEKAEGPYQRALGIRKKALGPEHPVTATSLNNLALLYKTTGAYAKAEPLYQRALAIKEKTLGHEHPDTAGSLNNLADLYRVMGTYAKAESLYQRALAINEKILGPEHPDTARSLNNLAGLHWVVGDFPQAIRLHERAQTIQKKNTSDFLVQGGESRKQAYLRTLRGDADAYASLSVAMLDPRAHVLGLAGLLEYKGRVLDIMSDSVSILRRSVRPQDKELFQQFVAVAQQRSNLTFQGLGNLRPETYRTRLSELAAEQEKLEDALSSRSATFRQQVTPIALEGVRQVLPSEAALVEWFRYLPYDPKAKSQDSKWGNPRYVAYVLKREGDVVAIDVGEAEPIEHLVNNFRAGLNDPNSTYVKDAAKELSEKLLQSLYPHIAKVEHLLISPDGALNLIPFGALLDEKGQYLAKGHEITYLTSGRDLLRFGIQAPARSGAIVAADPAFGKLTVAQADTSIAPRRAIDMDRGGMQFKPLPGTAKEAQALKALLNLDPKDLLTQGNASEANIKALQGPRILHLATHGFFLKDNEIKAAALTPVALGTENRPLPLTENPLLRSGLALAGANERKSGDEDGILTAAEVAQLDLNGTQLVVLSACETGVGDVRNGDGVYGLRRALVLAGAQSQLASLWKVADDATKDLMVDYYQRLLKGEGRSAALRSAQKAMMESKERSHPYYWAAFVPIGNWAPLPTDGTEK